MFQAFLRTEFSEENLEFWLACEDFKKVKSQSKMAAKAKKIFAEFIAIQACKEVRPPAQEPFRCKEAASSSGREEATPMTLTASSLPGGPVNRMLIP